MQAGKRAVFMSPWVRLAIGGVLVLLSACGTLEIRMEGTPAPDVAATGTVGALQVQNAEMATRLAAVTPPKDVPTPAKQNLAATRISFLSGASVGVVSAPIAPGQTQTYVLDAFQSQPMYVYLASGSNDVTLSLRTDAGASILAPAARKNSWQGTLPQTGDYYLSVHGGASIENFSLTVTVPWRLQFANGADAATVSGQTVAGYEVSYTVHALKGQTLSVDLEQLSSKASLSVYGFTDGQRYLRSDEGRKSYQFMLPATQDYIVVVVPFGHGEVSYTLTVKIQ